MKKIVIFTSDSYRHKFFIKSLSESFFISGVVLQKKKIYYNQQKKDSELIKNHLINYNLQEEKFYKSKLSNSELKYKILKINDINSFEVINFLEKLNFDAICVFGTSLIKKIILEKNYKLVNLHLGVSPEYKGSATLFWTIYNEDYHLLGTTCHLIDSNIDTGDIIGHSFSKINFNKSYYENLVNIVHDGIIEFTKLLTLYLNEKIMPKKQDKGKTKGIFRKKDFNESALKLVLNKFR